jgi:vacuolar-type H+-ATPase subunit D/Vma8
MEKKGGQLMVQQKQLLQKIEEATTLLRTLKGERDDAIVHLGSLEQENKELQALLTLVESKATEMLTIGSFSQKTQPRVTTASAQRKTEPAVAVASAQPKVEMPAVPAQPPAVAAQPRAETAAPIEANQAEAVAVASADKTEDKNTPPRGFADLKDRFRRPFP